MFYQEQAKQNISYSVKSELNKIKIFYYSSKQMLNYLQERLFSHQKQLTLERINNAINDLQSDNILIQQQLKLYEDKIQLLPSIIKRKILEQHKQTQNNLQGSNSPNFSDNQSQEDHPHSDQNVFTPFADRKILYQKLANLEQQQNQIDYIARLTDIYIRCKKQNNFANRKLNRQVNLTNTQQIHLPASLQREELYSISQFIKTIELYDKNQQNDNTKLVNDLIRNICLHTSKILTQKCENLIHHGPSGKSQKLIIESYLIRNCRSILLGEQVLSNNIFDNKTIKIVNKFLERILGQVLYYDVSYKKMIVMQLLHPQQQQLSQQQQSPQEEQLPKSNQVIILRKKLLFYPNQAQKHYQSIKITLKFHLQKVNELKQLLIDRDSSQLDLFKYNFDKLVEKHVSLIKSNLQYILPYINIKSRKDIMSILTHENGQTIQFQDLVLRLKFKGQDGDMFMNNLDAVFAKLIQVRKNCNPQQQKIIFNDNNFQTLTNFYQLGIYQAQQSLLQLSSKAIIKVASNLSKKGNWQLPHMTVSSTKNKSKKLFNMIFFSVSNLIDRFDLMLDENINDFYEFSSVLNGTYEEKLSEWISKLIVIRESVRKRIHQQ